MSERWLPIEGYEGRYEVSDHGRVRSFVSPHGERKNPLILKAGISKGYETVVLCKANPKRRTHRVHNLVLIAFIGPAPIGKPEGRHLDGNRRHNRPLNLVWGSRQENAQDMAAHGTAKGEGNARAKLSDDDVRAIRKRYETIGSSHRKMAAEYGVAKSTIGFAITGQTWSHVS